MPYSRTGSSTTFNIIALGWGSLLKTKERKAKQSTSDSFPQMYVLNNTITFFSCSRVLLPDITILPRAQRRLGYSVPIGLELFPTYATVRESYGLQQCSTAP